jgi:peptide/nickel transport system permease protein
LLMYSYIIQRLILFIPTLFILTILLFLFLRIIPGDPAVLMLAGDTGTTTFTQEDLEALQRELGTDKPIHIQYVNWIWDLLHGDLGKSYYRGEPLTKELRFRIPLTLQLTSMALVISFLIGVPLGTISALNQDNKIDYGARIITFIGLAVPHFVMAIATIYVLVQFFGWFPPLDYMEPWEDPLTNLKQLVFPALVLGSTPVAFVARMTRSSMLEVLREDYIRTARAKGLREKTVILVHALRNAFLPIITFAGWSFGTFLAGAVIVETIFLLPGMGMLLLDSIRHRDYPVIQAEIFCVAAMVLLLNLIIDLIYGLLDPRIRYA